MKKKHPQIFISYKRVDKQPVFGIKERIEKHVGKNCCWIDIAGIESDAQFANVIIKAINNASVFLFMYSASHNQIEDYDTDWTVREINFAQKKKKRIVFVNIDNTPLTDWFELFFGLKQQIDASSENAVMRLCEDLKKWLGAIDADTDVIDADTENLLEEATSNNAIIKGEQKDLSLQEVDKGGTYHEHEKPKTLPPAIRRLIDNMVYVEGGTFMMGATAEQGSDAYDWEKPTHQVTLSSFHIGKYEVTQAEWLAVMGVNPSHFKGDNLPVEQVSWEDCQTFIRKLNKMTGKNFRLPTEAEWEYAARGGNQSKETKYAGSGDIDEVAWFLGNSNIATHAVGTKSVNELGLYDMSGNVYEWCQDWYDGYNHAHQTNPIGPNKAPFRVFRGGSWNGNARCCRVSFRYGSTPNYRIINLGLRLAL